MLKNLIIATLAVALIGLGVYRMSDAHVGHTIIPNPNIPQAFYTPGGGWQCDWWHTDINHDCVHNIADRGLVAGEFGINPPTYTPTITPTHTPTNTPTNTPTATPTTMFDLTTLINDSSDACTNGGTVDSGGACPNGGSPVYPNQGSLCSPPAGWDWGSAAKNGLSGDGATNVNERGWWTAQWTACGDSASDITILVTDFHNVGWTGSAWVDLGGDWLDWDNCHIFNPTTVGTDFGTCTNPPTMATGQRALHGSTDTFPSQSVACVAVYYKAKQTGTKPIMANAGADNVNSSSGSVGDIFISRYKALNSSTYVQVGGTSCTASTVTNNPPPGF